MQVLAPGVEHSDEADLSTEVTRIGSDRAQCFGRRPEQDAVDRRLVLIRDVCDRAGQRVDEMEVWRREQLCFPLLQPLPGRRALAFWAVPVAAANGRRPLPVLWANSVMGSWRGDVGIFQ